MSKEVRTLRIVPRNLWDATIPEDGLLQEVSKPIRKVSFHYNTGPEECETQLECCRLVYDIQQRQMAAGAPDIEYNFLIGDDGDVYEGRGWKYKPQCAERYPACKDYTIEIAYLGDYRAKNQAYTMYLTAMALVDWGVHHEIIHRNFTYVGFMEKEVDYSKLPKKKPLLSDT